MSILSCLLTYTESCGIASGDSKKISSAGHGAIAALMRKGVCELVFESMLEGVVVAKGWKIEIVGATEEETTDSIRSRPINQLSIKHHNIAGSM